MPNRKNRSKKAIESLSEEIARHEQKLLLAAEAGDSGLIKYYEKEINGMKEQLKKRQKILDK